MAQIIEDRKNAFKSQLKADLISFLQSDKHYMNIRGIMGFGKTVSVKEVMYQMINILRFSYLVDTNETKPIQYILKDIAGNIIGDDDFYNYRAKKQSLGYNEECDALNYMKCYILEMWFIHYRTRFKPKELAKYMVIVEKHLGCNINYRKWNALKERIDPDNILYHETTIKNAEGQIEPTFKCNYDCKDCWHAQIATVSDIFNSNVMDNKHGLVMANIRANDILNNDDHEYNSDVLIIDEDQINAVFKSFMVANKHIHKDNFPIGINIDDIDLHSFQYQEGGKTIFGFKTMYGSDIFIDWENCIDDYIESPELYWNIAELEELKCKFNLYFLPNNDILKTNEWKSAFHKDDKEEMRKLLFNRSTVEITYKDIVKIQPFQKVIFISATGSIKRVCSEFDISNDDFFEFDLGDDYYDNPCFLINRTTFHGKAWGINVMDKEITHLLYYPDSLRFKHPLFVMKLENSVDKKIIAICDKVYGKGEYNIVTYPSKGSNEYHEWRNERGELISLDSVWVLGRFGINPFQMTKFEDVGIDISNIDWEAMVQTIGRARFFEHPDVPVFLFCDKDVSTIFTNVEQYSWKVFSNMMVNIYSNDMDAFFSTYEKLNHRKVNHKLLSKVWKNQMAKIYGSVLTEPLDGKNDETEEYKSTLLS